MSGPTKAKDNGEAVLLTDAIEVALEKLKAEKEARKAKQEEHKSRTSTIPRSATEDVQGHFEKAPSLPSRGGLTPLRRKPSLVPRAATADEDPTAQTRKGKGPEASPFRRFLVNRQRLEDGGEIEETETEAKVEDALGACLKPKFPPDSPFSSRASSRSANRYSAALFEASSLRLRGFDISAFSLGSAPVTASVSPEAATVPSVQAISFPPPSPVRQEEYQPLGCFNMTTPKQIDGSVQTPFGWLASMLCSYQAVVHERQQHLLVVRHAERIDLVDPSWKASAQRPWDPPLSEQGKIQAYKLGALVRNENLPIHRVVCSPYLRCVETAAEVVRALTASWEELEGTLRDLGVDQVGGPGAPGEQWVASMAAGAASFRTKRSFDGQQGAAKQPEQQAHNGGRGKKQKQTRVAVRAHIEPALCEIRMSPSISPAAVTDDDRMFLPQAELEALLPEAARRSAGTTTHFRPPSWPEEVEQGMKRILSAGDYICEQYPQENVLLVTHSEAVQGSILRCSKKATVYNVKAAGFVHLERTVYVDTEDEDDRGVTSWKLATRSGQSGVYFTNAKPVVG